MQYSVPQFVDVEDKILPHLTIKQFLMLVFCGLLGVIYWALFNVSLIFFVLMFLTLLIFLPITFAKFNGRPLLSNLPNLIQFIRAPRYRIFMRMGAGGMVKKEEPLAASIPDKAEPSESRLKKLAYLLDEKTAEEERLLRTTK